MQEPRLGDSCTYWNLTTDSACPNSKKGATKASFLCRNMLLAHMIWILSKLPGFCSATPHNLLNDGLSFNHWKEGVTKRDVESSPKFLTKYVDSWTTTTLMDVKAATGGLKVTKGTAVLSLVTGGLQSVGQSRANWRIIIFWSSFAKSSPATVCPGWLRAAVDGIPLWPLASLSCWWSFLRHWISLACCCVFSLFSLFRDRYDRSTCAFSVNIIGSPWKPNRFVSRVISRC